jgi:hypothetical protein
VRVLAADGAGAAGSTVGVADAGTLVAGLLGAGAAAPLMGVRAGTPRPGMMPGSLRLGASPAGLRFLRRGGVAFGPGLVAVKMLYGTGALCTAGLGDQQSRVGLGGR